ncbi:putative acetyltransferase [Biscogniauxia mediterranea]|nr:putative acetyltransferase [Biscogniauxia mediterranea]
MKLQFRIATPDDASQLQVLVKSAYRGETSRQGWTTEADLLSDDRIDVKGIIAKITSPGTVVLMATDDDGSLVACCEMLKRSAHVAYFGMFAVDPRRQGRGLGRQVLSYIEDFCQRTWGASKLEMNVIWTRDELISWYIRRGFRKTGESKPFPYNELVNGVALRDDLYFEVLEKDLNTAPAASAAA